jgi:hypothetical protein
LGYLIKVKEGDSNSQEPKEIKPENGKNFKLKELYDMLDCNMIEVVNLTSCQIMIIDEEGKINDSPYNDMATYYFRKANPENRDFIVGNALVCSSDDLN